MTNHPRSAINVCPTHGETGNEPCAICYQPPTLTCSEVVERLQRECFNPAREFFDKSQPAWFDREQAEAILHSWRERRVQELEEALLGLLGPHEWEKDLSAAKESAERLLAKSEQIRKGAKHE